MKKSRYFIEIHVNKDRIDKYTINPSFIVVIGKLTNDLLTIAKKNNLKVVYIQNNYNKNITIEQLAKMCCISKNHFMNIL